MTLALLLELRLKLVGNSKTFFVEKLLLRILLEELNRDAENTGPPSQIFKAGVMGEGRVDWNILLHPTWNIGGSAPFLSLWKGGSFLFLFLFCLVFSCNNVRFFRTKDCN